MNMRVVECNVCGETLAAANDEELERQLGRHMESTHPSVSYEAETGRETVSREAYTASDS